MSEDADIQHKTFLRLGTLIFHMEKPIGLIATAIEKCGVHTWDRYGRRKLYPPGTEECTKALDLLATAYSARMDPDGSDEWELFSDAGGDAYGWPSDDMPDLDNLEISMKDELRVPKRSSSGPSTRTDNAHLGIILGLLRFLKGELNNKPHPDWKNSEDALASFIESNMIGYPGVSQSNLTKKFTLAKQLIPKTELES
jgi:hypothetical protein